VGGGVGDHERGRGVESGRIELDAVPAAVDEFQQQLVLGRPVVEDRVRPAPGRLEGEDGLPAAREDPHALVPVEVRRGAAAGLGRLSPHHRLDLGDPGAAVRGRPDGAQRQVQPLAGAHERPLLPEEEVGDGAVVVALVCQEPGSRVVARADLLRHLHLAEPVLVEHAGPEPQFHVVVGRSGNEDLRLLEPEPGARAVLQGEVQVDARRVVVEDVQRGVAVATGQEQVDRMRGAETVAGWAGCLAHDGLRRSAGWSVPPAGPASSWAPAWAWIRSISA